MTTPCGKCYGRGPSCMPVVNRNGEPKAPCIVCGMPTAMMSGCGFPRHYDCQRYAALLGAAPPVIVLPDRRPEPVWLGAKAKREAATRAPDKVGPIQPTLRSDLLALGLDPALVLTGVALWNEAMRNIRYDGAHSTALHILNGSLKHAQVPAVPELPAGTLAPLDDGPIWKKRSWLTPDALNGAGHGPADVLAGFDVNGNFHGAGEIELGVGAPLRMDWPKDEVCLTMPGWVRTSSLENAPWSMGDHWQEGMWVPVPIAAYWREQGAQYLITEALVFPKSRRWLRTHTRLLREARIRLQMDGSPAALAVLVLLKKVTTRMFGGLLSSTEHNHGDSMHKEARSEVVYTAQARFFMALDQTRIRPGVGVVGLHADAAWFVMPEGFKTPPGLTVFDHPGKPCPDRTCHMLGKFKPAGRVPWTPELTAAWQNREHKTLWRALGGRD